MTSSENGGDKTKYLSEEDEQFVAEDFQGAPRSKSPVRSNTLLSECYEYINTVKECSRVQTVPDLLSNVSYVYLTWNERIALAWRILKTAFR